MNIPIEYWSCTAAIIRVECIMIKGGIMGKTGISSSRNTLS